MKNYFSFVLLAAALLFASTAQAQALHVKADIPFDFVVGNGVLRGGLHHRASDTIFERAAARW